MSSQSSVRCIYFNSFQFSLTLLWSLFLLNYGKENEIWDVWSHMLLYLLYTCLSFLCKRKIFSGPTQCCEYLDSNLAPEVVHSRQRFPKVTCWSWKLLSCNTDFVLSDSIENFSRTMGHDPPVDHRPMQGGSWAEPSFCPCIWMPWGPFSGLYWINNSFYWPRRASKWPTETSKSHIFFSRDTFRDTFWFVSEIWKWLSEASAGHLRPVEGHQPSITPKWPPQHHQEYHDTPQRWHTCHNKVGNPCSRLQTAPSTTVQVMCCSGW